MDQGSLLVGSAPVDFSPALLHMCKKAIKMLLKRNRETDFYFFSECVCRVSLLHSSVNTDKVQL